MKNDMEIERNKNIVPKYKEMESSFKKTLEIIDDAILKNYVTNLYQLIPEKNHEKLSKTVQNVRMYRITKMVYEKNEFSLHKFTSVFNSLSHISTSVFLMIDSNGLETELYVGIKSDDKRRTATSTGKLLFNILKGQFPGIELQNKFGNEIEDLLNKPRGEFVSAVTSIGNLVDEENRNNEEFVQGLEKLIKTMEGQKYRAVILAENKSNEDLKKLRTGYEEIYNSLSPFSKMQINFSENKGTNYSNSSSIGISTGTTYSKNDSVTEGNSYSENESTSEQKSVSKKNLMEFAAASVSGIGAGAGIGSLFGPVGATIGAGIGLSLSMGATPTYTEGKTRTKGSSYTETSSKTFGETRGETNTNTKTDTETIGNSSGSSQAITLNTENKIVSNLLNRIDVQLERIKEFETFGMWECAAYFISEEPPVAEIAAATYKSIIQGKNSGVEVSSINTWNENNAKEIIKYINNFEHPSFKYNNDVFVKATSLISSKELGIQMGLPKKSVVGFPVVEHNSFGQEIITYNENENNNTDSIKIGKVFNMGKTTEKVMKLDKESLAMHTFITGSTGSGKSNTIYEILDQLDIVGIKFMIIEPAKGEYKNVFGNKNNVTVLGTNPNYSELLRINPFKFPKSVHVLEHVDRLIEIFNVCWPMYAAMPAVLKDAVLSAYEDCGWDLVESVNKISDELFPTFADLERELWTVIENSAYSDELKGNYIGSLVTRIKSLTNGLNGQIFASDEIDNKLLFDENVIIDLSRIGSLETKSLIMGILVMRLNEYRMSEATEMNSKLKHVTVLEEAHNILKRVSTEQNSESSNVSGKSVEMLSNAIAEMRTYGEGFIIADQSPNAVDVSAIRNTNTKIIMRLPDEVDRRLAGKAAALKDEQLDEIAKLPKGVAVVYQNDWIEPVLCKINKFEGKEEKYNYTREYTEKIDECKLKQELLKLLLKTKVNQEITPNIEYIDNTLTKSKLSTIQKIEVLELLDEYRKTNKLKIWENNNFEKLSKIVTNLIVDRNNLKKLIITKSNFEDLNKELVNLIEKNVNIEDDELKLAILQSLMKEFSLESKTAFEIYSAWREFVTGGNVK
ncbi:ATP-binding protein [Leptotrichia massiliensis]